MNKFSYRDYGDQFPTPHYNSSTCPDYIILVSAQNRIAPSNRLLAYLTSEQLWREVRKCYLCKTVIHLSKTNSLPMHSHPISFIEISGPELSLMKSERFPNRSLTTRIYQHRPEVFNIFSIFFVRYSLKC